MNLSLENQPPNLELNPELAECKALCQPFTQNVLQYFPLAVKFTDIARHDERLEAQTVAFWITMQCCGLTGHTNVLEDHTALI